MMTNPPQDTSMPVNQPLHMQSNGTVQEMENPQTNEEVFNSSLSAILVNNVGAYVVVDFLIGTNVLTQREGVLYTSGVNFLTLYDVTEDKYIVCDLFAVKFITFFNTGGKPPANRNPSSESQNVTDQSVQNQQTESNESPAAQQNAIRRAAERNNPPSMPRRMY